MSKLTKTLIDNTNSTSADYWLWDSELPGFGVRIQASGRKTYVVRYRNASNTQRKQTIARCCDMAPDKARDLARKVFGQVAEGKDPLQAKREARAAATVQEMSDRYMKEHAKPFKKARSVQHDERNWRLYILPALGSKKVRDVTKADVLKLFGTLSEKPAVGNQVLALLSKAMNLSEDWGYRDQNTNPCRRIRKYDIAERELILTPEQIGTLNLALDDLEDEKVITQPMAALVRLLLLTGCRLTEIMRAKRSWVDFDRRLLLLPDSKVGQRKIPLSAAAIMIIESMPEAEWLIPGRITNHAMLSPYSAWKKIKARAGLPKELRLHDLRHTAGSLGHNAGLSQKQIAIQLGHRQLSTTERYLHGLKSDQARAADKIAEIVTSSWSRNTTIPSSDDKKDEGVCSVD